MSARQYQGAHRQRKQAGRQTAQVLRAWAAYHCWSDATPAMPQRSLVKVLRDRLPALLSSKLALQAGGA